MSRRYYKLPPLTSLATFETAARHRSFKGAAEELYFSFILMFYENMFIHTYVYLVWLECLQDKKSRKEQKKNGRNKKLSRLFASDCEDELQSVVSDNPNLYNRSISMVGDF